MIREAYSLFLVNLIRPKSAYEASTEKRVDKDPGHAEGHFSEDLEGARQSDKELTSSQPSGSGSKSGSGSGTQECDGSKGLTVDGISFKPSVKDSDAPLSSSPKTYDQMQERAWAWIALG